MIVIAPVRVAPSGVSNALRRGPTVFPAKAWSRTMPWERLVKTVLRGLTPNYSLWGTMSSVSSSGLAVGRNEVDP